MKQAEKTSFAPPVQEPEADSSVVAAPASLANHVCPFCGSLAVNADDPCMRCGMQNTVITRKATVDRIGPWYVLQSRNPSAPGMKFNTLKSLAGKGRIRRRSVVRGPTTDQLWKFAAEVRGLSRELGVCWSCQAEIQKNSPACPHCAALQEPPANPDLLLESAAVAIVAPVRKISQLEAEIMDANSAIDLDSMEPRPARPTVIRPTTNGAAIAARGVSGNGLGNRASQTNQPKSTNHVAPAPAQNSAMDESQFAAAFVKAAQPAVRRRSRAGRLFLAFLLLLIAGSGVVASVPNWRAQALIWIKQGRVETQKDWVILKSDLFQSSPTAPAGPTNGGKHAGNKSTELPPAVSDSATPAAAQLQPDNSVAAIVNPTPATQPDAVTNNAAANNSAAGDKTAADVPAVVPATQAVVAVDDAAASDLGMILHGKAIDAMGGDHPDYAKALGYLHQIQQLPQSDRPTDLPILLQQAQEAQRKMTTANGAN